MLSPFVHALSSSSFSDVCFDSVNPQAAPKIYPLNTSSTKNIFSQKTPSVLVDLLTRTGERVYKKYKLQLYFEIVNDTCNGLEFW
jgi:hypothetical protein